jgi:hypothetical protein
MSKLLKAVLVSILVMISTKGWAGAPPPNDNCNAPVDISTLPSTKTGATLDATGDTPLSGCGTSIDGPGVWYTVTGNGRTITATTCNSSTNYDTKLNVYCANCNFPVCIGGNDDRVDDCPDAGSFSGLTSQVSWCSREGDVYLIFVSGFDGDTGNFGLVVSDDGDTCLGAPTCPNHGVITGEVGSFDIIPQKNPNVIRSCGNNPIPVAIFGNGFDVNSDIDLMTMKFGKGGATSTRNQFRDLNRDGSVDLKSAFRCGDSGIESGDILACVSGGSAPSSSDCCVPQTGTAGCSNTTCENLICDSNFDPYCCDTEWDVQCADEGNAICSACNPQDPFYGCDAIMPTF